MVFKVNDQEYLLKYSFNSMRYLEDFDVKNFDKLESKPFLVASIVLDMLYAALNNNPKIFYSKDTVSELLDSYILEKNSIMDLMNDLSTILEESDFFKGLQVKE